MSEMYQEIKSSAKYNKIIKFCIDKYCELTDNKGYVPIFYNMGPNISGLNQVKQFNLSKSKYNIIDITPISNDVINFVNHSYGIRVNGKYPQTGIYKITLASGEIVIYAEYFSFHITAPIHSYFIGNKRAVSGLISVHSRMEKQQNKKAEIDNDKLVIKSNGFYEVFWQDTPMGSAIPTIRKSKIKVNTIPIDHPVLAELHDDRTMFFKNISMFKRYGQPGVRKVLLVGPPGTGKTSIFHKIVRENKDNYAICSVTSIQDAYIFLTAVAKSDYKGILFWEDAETSMQDSSQVLNFLDGLNQPKNKDGSYVIMTTNNPDKIAGRILKRPGRIDRYMFVGTLKGNYAINCFNTYAPKSVRIDPEFLLDHINDFTGAQIKEIVHSCKLKAAGQGTKITETVVSNVVSEIKEGYNIIEKFAAECGAIERQASKFGFVQTTTAIDRNKNRSGPGFGF